MLNTCLKLETVKAVIQQSDWKCPLISHMLLLKTNSIRNIIWLWSTPVWLLFNIGDLLGRLKCTPVSKYRKKNYSTTELLLLLLLLAMMMMKVMVVVATSILSHFLLRLHFCGKICDKILKTVFWKLKDNGQSILVSCDWNTRVSYPQNKVNSQFTIMCTQVLIMT